MNKIKFLSCAAALLATLTGCNTDDSLGSASSSKSQTPSITAITPNGGTTTRTAYEQDGTGLNVTWSASDEKMYYLAATEDTWTAGQLIQDVTDAPSPTADEASSAASSSAATQANFTAYDVDGSGTTPIKKAGSIFALYPQKSDYANAFKSIQEEGTTASVTLPLSNQTGKLADLHNLDYMTATSDVKANDGNIEVSPLQMNHEIAVLHIAQGSEVSLASGSVTKIEISATSGFYSSGTMTITRNGSTITSNITGTIGTITINDNFAVADNKLSDDVYVAILPTASFSGLKAKFTYSNGDSYTYTYTGSTSKFEKGKVYNWSPEIAAADKEFTIETYKKEIYHWYGTSNASYSNGIYTMDKLFLKDSENTTKYGGDLKISLIITVKNGNVAKCTNFNLKSVKAAYAMYDPNTKVDIDRMESFSIQGWYTSSDCSGTPSQSPDATHIFGKCIVSFKQLNLDGSDFYKEIMKNCEFTVVNDYGKEASFTKNYVEEAINFVCPPGRTKENTYIKFQTPAGWKTLSCAAILAL